MHPFDSFNDQGAVLGSQGSSQLSFMDVVRDAGSSDYNAAYQPRKHKQPAYGQSHRHGYKQIKGQSKSDEADVTKESEASASVSGEDLKPKPDRQKSPKAEKQDASHGIKGTNDEEEETVDVIPITPATSTTDAEVALQFF